MPNKMTAEFFAQLPPEVQQQILQNYPADKLRNLRVINLSEDMGNEEVKDILLDMWEQVPKEAHFAVFATAASLLFSLTGEAADLEDIPVPPQSVGIVLMAHRIIEITKEKLQETYDRQEGDDEDD